MFDTVGRSQGLHNLLAVTLAELRSVSRLARTWVFLALGIAVVGTAYGYYSFLHARSSFGSLSMGNSLPRLTTAYFNSYVLWFFMAALVFLAFDLRHRDARERIIEAVDSRPLANVTLLGGRLCGIVLGIVFPLFGVLLLVQATGMIGRALGWPIDPIEPVSTSIFFFLDAVPAIILWGATVLLLAAGLRSRLAVAVAALALLGIHMWIVAQVPAYLLPAVSLLYIHDNWASDLAPRLPDLGIFLHRAAMLMLASAFLVWAAALYKRRDGGSRRGRLLFGTVPAALAVAGIGIVAIRCTEGMQLRDTWLAMHQAADDEPTPLVEHLAGQIAIDPGEELRVDLELQLAARRRDLSTLLFSFNPGMEVSELRLDDMPARFRHEHGLLRVDPPEPLAPGASTTLTLSASGVPDPDFAYLDSVVDWRRETSRNAILWGGTAGGIFEERYVALMPGLRWLPVPGANLDGARRGHAPTVDLTVEAPAAWLVAGPGRREELGNGRHRFRPTAQVPKVGLFASRWERRAMEVEGVEFELLLHPAHLRNLDYFADVHELLRSRLEQIVRDAADIGIPYPYDGFSVVEVPAHLREYGGGQWLDTRMALPGLLLLKEHGFPYANFERLNQFYVSGSWDAFKMRLLEGPFINPYESGSALQALSRNVVTFRSAAEGPGTRALDYVCETLGRELFWDPNRGRFAGPAIYTAHLRNADAGFGATVVQMVRGLASQRTGVPGFSTYAYFYAQPSVWERALGSSLADMDFEHDPRKAIGAFGLRVNAIARSIIDGLGRHRTGTLLAELRRHADGIYDAAEFTAAGTAAGADLERLVGDWLHDAALPGFVASRAQVARLPDDVEGRPRYQIRIHVRNDEPTPGLLRLSLGVRAQSARSEPVRVEGNTTVEIGMVSAEPPATLWAEPYLALNRVPFQVELADMDSQDVAHQQPFVGSRPSAWSPPATKGIVIDDLDPGFAVQRRDDDSRLGGNTTRHPPWVELDQGLPDWSLEPGEWTRASIPSSWGKYRHTVAGAIAGDGTQVAVFTADLSKPGRWQLDYHLPNRNAMGMSWMTSFGELGAFEMALVVDGNRTAVDFDGSDAAVGWNKLGEYDLPSTTVLLEITSRTDGEMVIADAIRWAPLD